MPILYYPESVVMPCDDPPVITLDPIDQTVSAGVQATLTAASSNGCPPVVCRWQELINGVWTDIAGETGTTLEVTPNATPVISIVQNLDCGTATETSVEITWSPPASNGTAAIVDYEIQYRVLGSGATFTSTTDTASPFVITGLTQNTTYEILVRARNGVDADGPFATVNCPTDAAPVTDAEFIDSWGVWSDNAQNAPVTVPVTAGVIQVGDLLVFSDTADGPSSTNAVKTFQDPAGATQVTGYPDQGAGFAPAQTWWFKVATAADAAATDFTFGATNANQHAGFVHVIRNATTATAGSNLADGSFGASTITLPADTVPAGSVYLTMLGVQGSAPTVVSAPAGQTIATDLTPGFHSGATAYEEYAAAGSTGASTWTISGNTARSASAVIVS